MLNEPWWAFTYTGGKTSQWLVRNIFGTIPTAENYPEIGAGASSFTRIGAEIVDPYLKMKGTWLIEWQDIVYNAPTAYGTIHLYVYIVSSNEQIEAGTPQDAFALGSANANGSLNAWFLQEDGSRIVLNGNNVRVLKKWHRQVTPPNLYDTNPTLIGTQVVVNATTTRGRQEVPVRLNWRKKGKLTYEDYKPATGEGSTDFNLASSSTLKGMNYYVLVGWHTTGDVTTSQKPQFLLDSYMYFKDP